jgi:hydroxypyruvate reductase
VLVALGKAAGSMTTEFCRRHGAPVRGIALVPHSHPHAPMPPGIELLHASHPVPDEASIVAGRRLLELVRGLGPDDRVVALVSGGGSSLAVVPAPGITLADKQAVTRELLGCGAGITEINCVRRKLSALKGGHLARAAFPAEVLLLAISDVPGDDVADIASGPFSPDVSTLADAMDVLARHGCPSAERLRGYLADRSHETPKPGDAVFARVTSQLVARSADALAAAAGVLRQSGYEPLLMDGAVDCPARELAAAHARLAREHRAAGSRVALVTGGETTVRLASHPGRGGRNTEYLLALALALDGAPGVWALAADTDGIDGTGEHAGALLAPDSLRRAAALELDAAALLAGSASREFFAALGDLLVSGPTGTNVNDLRVVLVGTPQGPTG